MKIFTSILLLGLFNSLNVFAQNISVNLDSYADFKDFKIRYDSNNRDKQRLKEQLIDLIGKSVSKKIQSGKFEINITDIDLPGRFLPSSNNMVRYVLNGDLGYMNFTYKYTDTSSSHKSESVRLTFHANMGKRAALSKYKNTNFEPLMKSFDQWLSEFPDN